MIWLRRIAIGAALALAAPFAAPAQAQPGVPAIHGMWMNPHGTVAVRTGACGGRLCGWIVWASPQAQEDARDGGVVRLIGTTLLEDYLPDGPGNWSGTVFVPDMGRRFASEIEQVDGNAMKVKGCILHGMLCKSQVWRRIAELPHD